MSSRNLRSVARLGEELLLADSWEAARAAVLDCLAAAVGGDFVAAARVDIESHTANVRFTPSSGFTGRFASLQLAANLDDHPLLAAHRKHLVPARVSDYVGSPRVWRNSQM